MKIAIVGAGVAGLAIGWRLKAAGFSVEILERGLAGHGATWASAGMIAPGAELGLEKTAMARFAGEARAKWPAFARELEAASGMPIDYRESGSLIVAQTAAKAAALENRAAALARERISAAWVPGIQLREREPLLSGDLIGALHLRDDAQVDNRALTEALCGALTKCNVAVRECCEVRSVVVRDGRAQGVVSAHGIIEADLVILACGAWMNLIGGIGAEKLPPVKPAKGQMVACVPPPGVSLPQSLIWTDDIYLVPRQGRLFIGATVEDVSFDTSVSREARDQLLHAAGRVIPSLEHWRVAEMWAGLRPRTPDDAPVLGATAIGSLHVAGGQFRNGILFAPAVADTLCRAILAGAQDAEPGPFDPRRFDIP